MADVNVQVDKKTKCLETQTTPTADKIGLTSIT